MQNLMLQSNTKLLLVLIEVFTICKHFAEAKDQQLR